MYHWERAHTHTHTRPFFWDHPGEGYQKGKTNLDFTEARDSEWQWHQLEHMQVCTYSSRQITMPTPHHSVFYRPDALPAAQPTASKHWRQSTIEQYNIKAAKLTAAGSFCCELSTGTEESNRTDRPLMSWSLKMISRSPVLHGWWTFLLVIIHKQTALHTRRNNLSFTVLHTNKIITK